MPHIAAVLESSIAVQCLLYELFLLLSLFLLLNVKGKINIHFPKKRSKPHQILLFNYTHYRQNS